MRFSLLRRTWKRFDPQHDRYVRSRSDNGGLLSNATARFRAFVRELDNDPIGLFYVHNVEDVSRSRVQNRVVRGVVIVETVSGFELTMIVS